jgi:hypothetical protein
MILQKISNWKRPMLKLTVVAAIAPLLLEYLFLKELISPNFNNKSRLASSSSD